MEPEAQQLLGPGPPSLGRTGVPPGTCCDSAWELSPSACGEDEPRRWDRLCPPSLASSEIDGDGGRRARRKLGLACAVSLVFMAGEMMGGYAARSLAIMTDAAHLLADFGSIAISLFSLWLSSRPPTGVMTFGWHRAEILGLLLSLASVWAVTAALLLSAGQRLIGGGYDVDGQIMLVTSGCAVGANVLMVLILHQSGVSHGHGRAPQQRGHCYRGNASVRAAFVHVVGDLVQSVGVLVAATVIHFWPEYQVADPICTFLFSALVLGTTVPVAKDVLRILMEGAPRDVGLDGVRKQLLCVRGVAGVHSLHLWSLDATRRLLSVHVSAEEDADAQVLLADATKLLRAELGFWAVTVQVER